MTLRCLPVFLFVFTLALPSVALADPRCGGVDNGVLGDVWDLADDVRYYRDYRSPIERVCEAMEALEKYEKSNTLSKAENDILEDRIELLEEAVERQLETMGDSLKAIEVWLRADPDNSRQRINRYVSIKDARRRVEQISGDLERSRTQALTLATP